MALPQHLRDLAARVSNAGRWGADDRRGTLNLIDAAAVQRGLAAARTGAAYSLTIPFDENGPQTGMIPGRTNPELEATGVNVSMTGDPGDFCSSDDRVAMGLQAATHWDALAHVGYDGELYNHVPDSTNDARGAHELGIDRFGPIVSRGVLLDVARTNGLERLPGGHAITGDDLERAAVAAGVTIEPGDIALVRTGHIAIFLRGDRRAYAEQNSPGLSTQSIEWLRDNDVAAVATDTLIFEVWPCEDPAVLLPVHMIHLRDIGLVQGQNWMLEDLAAACAADRRGDCLLVATPVPFTRALGAPVAPTAIR
jgi:kynurenine formamidase